MTMRKSMKQWERQDGIAFLRSIGVREGHGLLDFGCRVGHYSIPAAFAVGRSGIVYALDKAAKPLDELMKKAGKYGLQNIKAIRTSGQLDIDIESRSIDIALLYDVLHYFTRSQRRVLFREMFRVLKPTGLLSVYPKHTVEDWPSGEFKDLRIVDIEQEICECGFRTGGLYEAIVSHDDAPVPGHVVNFGKQ